MRLMRRCWTAASANSKRQWASEQRTCANRLWHALKPMPMKPAARACFDDTDARQPIHVERREAAAVVRELQRRRRRGLELDADARRAIVDRAFCNSKR